MSKYLPIINSRFEQEREWPTPAVGPNYTRPVFAENGPGGNMSRSPILVAGGRSFAGLGGLRQGIFGANNVLGAADSETSDDTSTTDVDPTQVNPADPGPAASVAGACNSAAVIKVVQAAIGTGVDGKWGPLSTAALKKSGQSFQALAPGCTGSPPPGVATSGGGVTSTIKSIASTFGGGTPGTTTTASAFSNPTTWIVLAVLAAGGIILFGKKDKKEVTPNRRRRHARR